MGFFDGQISGGDIVIVSEMPVQDRGDREMLIFYRVREIPGSIYIFCTAALGEG